MRRTLVAFSVALALTSCGGDSLSLTDYVDRVNAMVVEEQARIGPLHFEYQNLLAPTVDDFTVLLEQELTIRLDLQETIVGLDPPDQIADLHTTMVEWHAAAIEAEQALSVRATEAAGWSDLEQSAEARAYDAVMADGLVACHDLQAKLDATAARGVFADTPWIPSKLKEIVNAAFGCDTPPGE